MVVVLVCAVLGLLSGAAVPRAIMLLREPPPDQVRADLLTRVAAGEALSVAEQGRLDEGPKELYADLGALSGLVAVSAAISAAAAAQIGGTLGWDWRLLLVLPLAPVGTLLGIVDWRTRLLPREVVLPVTALALAYGLVAWPLLDAQDELVRGLIGLVVARSVFWVLWFVRQAGLGFGDVRLAAWLGFLLAYLGWAQWLVGIYAGFLLFVLPALMVALVRRDRTILKKAYPLGPFLLLGAVLGVIAGPAIVSGLFSR